MAASDATLEIAPSADIVGCTSGRGAEAAGPIDCPANNSVIPGYAFPLVFTTCHAWRVPSLQYAYMIGGGGRSRSSPEAAVCW